MIPSSDDSPAAFDTPVDAPTKTPRTRKTKATTEEKKEKSEEKPKATRTRTTRTAKTTKPASTSRAKSTAKAVSSEITDPPDPPDTTEKPKVKRTRKSTAASVSNTAASVSKEKEIPAATEEAPKTKRTTTRARKAATTEDADTSSEKNSEESASAKTPKTTKARAKTATAAKSTRISRTSRTKTAQEDPVPQQELFPELLPEKKTDSEKKTPDRKASTPTTTTRKTAAARKSTAAKSKNAEEQDTESFSPSSSQEATAVVESPDTQKETSDETSSSRPSRSDRNRNSSHKRRYDRKHFHKYNRDRDNRDRDSRDRDQDRSQRSQRPPMRVTYVGESPEERQRRQAEAEGPVELVPGEGILEISGKGFGFIRDANRNFNQSPRDIFVKPEIVRKYGLRDGMWISGKVRKGNRGPQLDSLELINGDHPEVYQAAPMFEELTTINPIEHIKLETTPENYTTRIIDMMAPIGKGQRGLIVAPPRTGKTTLLQHIAEAITINHPDMKLIILLVDERPEEVTEISRACPKAEVLASSNDSDIKSHTKIAQLAIERAKRYVEGGKDVFMLMDSLTRIGRAFNNASSGSGRTLSGGMDARAMEIPRKLFAAARNTEEAGSLTIIATALIETGSRMDELIFQEFKGTGNMELVLDRKISDMRVYPAIDIYMSGTRREELLIPMDQLEKINLIRRGLSGHKPIEAVERLLSIMRKFPTNAQMLDEIPG